MGRFDALTKLDQTPDKPQSPHTSPPAYPLPSAHAVPAAPPSGQQPTGIPANQQTSKPSSMQTSKPVNQQTRLHANLQAGKHAIIEKYSTYLTPACKKGLKRIALETDRKDYEVLIEAVEQFLEKQK
jgi:hypothetical protein